MHRAPGDEGVAWVARDPLRPVLDGLCERLYADIPAVLDLQARTAERQVEREASWFRLAGFTMDAPHIDVVLSGSTP